MEGSPVRGQQKAPLIRLNESPDLKSFHAELVCLVAEDVKQAEILFSFLDGDSKSPALPSWILTYLERHSALQTKLEQGELVGISYAEESQVLRPATVARSSVVLIPVISNGILHA